MGEVKVVVLAVTCNVRRSGRTFDQSTTHRLKLALLFEWLHPSQILSCLLSVSHSMLHEPPHYLSIYPSIIHLSLIMYYLLVYRIVRS
jgi:hypothetical protein